MGIRLALMTEDEVCKEYVSAKDKDKQIIILAQLNCVKKQIIEEVLRNGGAMGKNNEISYAKIKANTLSYSDLRQQYSYHKRKMELIAQKMQEMEADGYAE